MKENDLICPICGEPTNSYMGNYRKDRLCRKHANELKDGLIEQCEDCGAWHEAGQSCKCKNKEMPHANNTSELTCIICGEPSNGKHFCRACYNIYKNRAVDIRITHCTDTEILDQYGNLSYKCADGRKVRSRAEAMISDWLYHNKIRSVYEESVYYTENGETKTLHPDFYLPDYSLYLEYNELTNKPYLKSKEYTKKIYNQIGVKVLIMDEKDLQDIAACLKPILGLH